MGVLVMPCCLLPFIVLAADWHLRFTVLAVSGSDWRSRPTATVLVIVCLAGDVLAVNCGGCWVRRVAGDM